MAVGSEIDSETAVPTVIDNFNRTISSRIKIRREEDHFLVVSPYEDFAHRLDLRSVSSECQLLAQALVKMEPTRTDYAIAPYAKAFNFDKIVDCIRALASVSNYEFKQSHFYIVVFRSRIPPTTVYADLGILDQDAHKEAAKSGGFLKQVNRVRLYIYPLTPTGTGSARRTRTAGILLPAFGGIRMMPGAGGSSNSTC